MASFSKCGKRKIFQKNIYSRKLRMCAFSSIYLGINNGSSRSVVLYKKDVLGNFAKLIGKHLLPKLPTWNFIKKETPAHIFSSELCKIFKNTNFFRTPLVAASKTSYVFRERTFYFQFLKRWLFLLVFLSKFAKCLNTNNVDDWRSWRRWRLEYSWSGYSIIRSSHA